MDEEERQGILAVLGKYSFSDMGYMRFPFNKCILETTAAGLLHGVDNKDILTEYALILISAQARIFIAVDVMDYGIPRALGQAVVKDLEFAEFKQHLIDGSDINRRRGLEGYLRSIEPSSDSMEKYYLRGIDEWTIYPGWSRKRQHTQKPAIYK